MAKPVSIHEAKTQLSRLIARAEAGEESIVRRGPKPVAKIVGLGGPSVTRHPGRLRGQVTLLEDFDAPVPGFEDLV
jgi:prevent-host-death family protein